MTSSTSRSKSSGRRTKQGREGGRIIRKKNLILKIIQFFFKRIWTHKSDLDPVKSRPDPQHWLEVWPHHIAICHL